MPAFLAGCLAGYLHAHVPSYLSLTLAAPLFIPGAIFIYLALFLSATLTIFTLIFLCNLIFPPAPHPLPLSFSQPPYDWPIMIPQGLRKAEALKQSIRRKTSSIVSRNELLEKKLMNPVVWTNAIGNPAPAIVLALALALSTAI